MTDTPPDPERPRRTLSLGIRRKPRPPQAPDEAASDSARVDTESADGEAPAESERPRRRSLGFRRRPRPDNPSPDAPPAEGEAEDRLSDEGREERPPTPGRLRRERRAIVEQRQVDVYHLGGLAFELYRRDLLAGAVLKEKALAIASLDARVRAIDDQLEELEEERRSRRASRGKRDAEAEVGACLACRAEFRAEAAYCWRCGAHVNPDANLEEHDTAVIGSMAS